MVIGSRRLPGILAALAIMVVASVLITVLPGSATAAMGFGEAPEPVTVTRTGSGPLVAAAGSTTSLNLKLTLEDGWHVNAREADETFIPLTVDLPDSPLFSSRNVTYPEPVEYEFPFSEEPLMVHEGSVNLPVVLGLSSGAPPGDHTLTYTVRYQACSKDRCLRPRTTSGTVGLNVRSPSPETVRQSGDTTIDVGAVGGVSSGSGTGWGFRQSFNGGNWLVGYAIVFVLGLSLNLTPCVYPLIPVTIGYFTNETGGSWMAQFRGAALFSLGLMLTYATLGTLAGLGGTILGGVLQSTAVKVVLATIVVLLAASMLDCFSWSLPGALRRFAERIGNSWGAFGMGLTLGVAAAPCLAPATVSLMAFVGQSGSAAFGFSLFLALGGGLSVPYFGLGLFSGLLDHLPSSGQWLEWMEYLLGWLLIGVALYFLWSLFSPRTMGWLVIGWLTVSALHLTVVFPPTDTTLYLARAAVIVLVAGLAAYPTYAAFINPPPSIDWTKSPSVLTGDNPFSKPTMVYFGAEWCFPCKRMNVTTFRDPAVRSLSETIQFLKVDLTESPGDPIDQWMTDRSIQGVPTMVFLTPDRRELRTLRRSGYVSGPDLAETLRTLLETSNVQ